MKALFINLTFFLFTTNTWATPTAQQPDRNVDFYNLNMGLGMEGYDPVSYFPEGGSQPLKGDSGIQITYGGVTYLFSSLINKDLFLDEPTRYEPTYGGFGAYAMSIGAFAGVNPEIYTINGKRLHLQISESSKRRFEDNLQENEALADEYFFQQTGELPRK